MKLLTPVSIVNTSMQTPNMSLDNGDLELNIPFDKIWNAYKKLVVQVFVTPYCTY